MSTRSAKNSWANKHKKTFFYPIQKWQPNLTCPVAIFICKNPLILSPAPYPVIFFLCFSFHPQSDSTTPPHVKIRIRKRSATSGGGNTLRAVRPSFEIQHLRRLSRGSADPREHSRSWGLAQSCPAHVAAPWCCRPLPGSSPFATIFFSTYPHYPHIYPHPQFPSLWIPLCITLFT